MYQTAKGKTGVVAMGICGSKNTCGKELTEKEYKKNYLGILGKGVVPSEGTQTRDQQNVRLGMNGLAFQGGSALRQAKKSESSGESVVDG